MYQQVAVAAGQSGIHQHVSVRHHHMIGHHHIAVLHHRHVGSTVLHHGVMFSQIFRDHRSNEQQQHGQYRNTSSESLSE